ncbi:MAG: hypothetical protein WEB60_08305 [Terrimicrobiaceae bacterium]
MNYSSIRSLARDCQTSPDALQALAEEINLGSKGPHKNSPRTLTPDDAQKLTRTYFARKAGETRLAINQSNARLHKALTSASRLASLARAHGHQGAELLELVGEELNSMPPAPTAKAMHDPAFANRYFAALATDSEKLARLSNLVAQAASKI